MGAFMAQRGRLVVCGDAGDALGDSIYEARLYVRGSVAEPRRRLRREGDARRARRRARASCSSGAGVDGCRSRGLPPLRLRAGSSTTSRSTTPGEQRAGALLIATAAPACASRRSFDRLAIHEIQRAARDGIYDIRGVGAKRRVPHFDDLLLLGASVSRYPLEGYRERCDTNVMLGARHAAKPLELEIPITIAGHELRRALGAGQGGARPRRDRRRARARRPATAA